VISCLGRWNFVIIDQIGRLTIVVVFGALYLIGDLKTGKRLLVFPGGRKNIVDFKGHTDQVICLAASSDNQFLASGGKDKIINVWSIQDNKLLHTFKQQHKDTITGMSFRKGHSNQLYTVSNDRTVKVWNVDELSYIETLFGHQDCITAVDSLAKEHCVSIGGRDRTVRLWKIVEESQLVFRGGGMVRPKKLNKDVDILGTNGSSEDGTPKMIATPGPDGGFVMREKKDPMFIEGSTDCLAMVDEENFLSGGDSGTISLWNVNKKKAVFSMPLAHGFHTQALDYSNGESIPGGGVETPYWVTSLASLRYSDLFVSGSWDGTVRVWQIGKSMKNFSLISVIPMVSPITREICFTNTCTDCYCFFTDPYMNDLLFKKNRLVSSTIFSSTNLPCQKRQSWSQPLVRNTSSDGG